MSYRYMLLYTKNMFSDIEIRLIEWFCVIVLLKDSSLNLYFTIQHRIASQIEIKFKSFTWLYMCVCMMM